MNVHELQEKLKRLDDLDQEKAIIVAKINQLECDLSEQIKTNERLESQVNYLFGILYENKII